MNNNISLTLPKPKGFDNGIISIVIPAFGIEKFDFWIW